MCDTATIEGTAITDLYWSCASSCTQHGLRVVTAGKSLLAFPATACFISLRSQLLRLPWCRFLSRLTRLLPACLCCLSLFPVLHGCCAIEETYNCKRPEHAARNFFTAKVGSGVRLFHGSGAQSQRIRQSNCTSCCARDGCCDAHTQARNRGGFIVHVAGVFWC